MCVRTPLCIQDRGLWDRPPTIWNGEKGRLLFFLFHACLSFTFLKDKHIRLSYNFSMCVCLLALSPTNSVVCRSQATSLHLNLPVLAWNLQPLPSSMSRWQAPMYPRGLLGFSTNCLLSLLSFPSEERQSGWLGKRGGLGGGKLGGGGWRNDSDSV